MPFDYGHRLADGQYERHPTDVPADRRFVRPVRTAYKHEPCGGVTTMGLSIAETYAAKPGFYTSTYCARCGGYFPVGAGGEFVWHEDGTKVGT